MTAPDPSLSTDPPAFDPARVPIVLNQSEAGRLLGCSRQNVNTMIKKGTIPADANGRVEVAKLARALIDREGPAAQPRLMPELRERIASAESTRDAAMAAAQAAEAARDAALMELQTERQRTAQTARWSLELQHALESFRQSDDDSDPVDLALEQAMDLCPDRFRADPALIALARRLPLTPAQSNDAARLAAEQATIALDSGPRYPMKTGTPSRPN